MKTSLTNVQLIEDYLLGRASNEQRLLFEARLLLDSTLQGDVYWQRKVYSVVRQYGRQQFRDELERLHQQLFTAPQHRAFRDKIIAFFQR